jgi:N-acetylglutamate synthase-like GNAT family acetyltransferase
MAKASIDSASDLDPQRFPSVLNNGPLNSGDKLWVLDSAEHGVIGCVGMKRAVGSSGPGELVRMSVSPKLQKSGFGRVLISSLVNHCVTQGIDRLFLTTGNPESVKFYKRVGFFDISVVPRGRVQLHQMMLYTANPSAMRLTLIHHGTPKDDDCPIQVSTYDCKCKQVDAIEEEMLVMILLGSMFA